MGVLSFEQEFSNDVAHGKFVEYIGNERKSTEGSYRNGERVGTWSYWDKYGNLTLTMTFKDGQMVSKQVYESKKADRQPGTPSNQNRNNQKQGNKSKVNNSKRFK